MKVFFWRLNFIFYILFLQPCRWRVALSASMVAMEKLQLENGRFFDEETARQFVASYLVFRATMNNLCDRALSQKNLRYHHRPKLHQLSHLTFHFVPRNPRYYSNYGGEDTVARIKRLAEKSHPCHTSRLTMQRYIMAMCLRWHGELV